MKKLNTFPFHCIITFLLTILILSSVIVVASAESLAKLEGEPVFDEGKLAQYRERLAFSTACLSEELSDRIVSFDVNESGQILLALENDQLAVIDQNGKQEYRFTFSASGSYYAQWNGKHILLYLVRSDLLFEYTLNGEMKSVKSIKQTLENTFLLDDIQKQTELRRDGVSYRVSKAKGLIGFFQGYTYDRVTKVETDGSEKVVLIISESKLHKSTTTILPVIFLIGIPVVIVFGSVIVPRVIRSRRNKRKQ